MSPPARTIGIPGVVLLTALTITRCGATGSPEDARSARAATEAPSPYERALMAYRAGRLEDAAQLLEALPEPQRGAGESALLGWCRLRLGRIDEADAAFRQAMAAAPKAADPKTGSGFVALRRRAPRAAEAAFRAAVALDPRSGEAWKGLGLALRDLDEPRAARDALARAAELNPADAETRRLLDDLTGPGRIVREARPREAASAATPLSIPARCGAARFEVRAGKGFRPFFVKGVNLGTALPGRFPAEFPDDPALYRTWFDQIGELGANVVRLYTLHPPSLYRALAEHNRERPAQKLWLVQGAWTELPDNDDYDGSFRDGFVAEIHRVVDAVHGNLELPARPGHASGRYDADVSGDLLAWLVGREWEPYSVIAYERIVGREPRPRRPAGDLVQPTAQASPFEAWLASICDETATYETARYRMQHPVGYVSWPTLDPLVHPTEATAEEETAIRRARGQPSPEPIREYDNDAVQLDARHIVATAEFRAGFYASYHAYPYYPDFMMLEPSYAAARDAEGVSRYSGYLRELKAHHGDQPVLIAEFGVPASRGIAHLQPEGQHHGGHTAPEQGRIDARLFRNIHDTGMAGGILFSWMDEWFKRNWIVFDLESPAERKPLWLNALDAEENYGLLGAWPGEAGWKIVLDGRGDDWTGVPALYGAGAAGSSGRRLAGLRVASDEAYIYLRVDFDPPWAGPDPLDWKGTRLLVGIDTYDARRGDHRFPAPLTLTTPVGLEFLAEFAGRQGAKLLVARPYDPFANRLRRPWASQERSDGDFISMMVPTNRDRFGRDGTWYPAKSYEGSALRYGSMDPDSPLADTLAEWIVSPGGDFLETRLPWGALNVTDPSSLRVLHEETARGGLAETRETEGFRFDVVLAGAAAGASVSRLPGSAPASPADYPVYRWSGWQQPRYHLQLKDSYWILKDALRRIPE